MALSIQEKKHVGCIELALSGSALTEDDFSPLISKSNGLAASGNSRLILNLEGIHLLNSLGISALIRIFTRCRNTGGDLYVVNISDKISQVLLLTKLNTVLNIAPSVEEAVSKFKAE